MDLRIASASDRGRVRELNEDSVLTDAPLVAVADGMGGHEGGEVASGLAVDVLKRWRSRLEGRSGADAASVLRDAFNEANRAVWTRGRSDRSVAGMGTTMTAGWVEGNVVALAHVGDSRAYLLRGSVLSKLTDDQNLAQEWVREGKLSEEEAAASPQRHILLQAIGTDPEHLSIDIASVELREGDRLLLATDGLYGMVRDEDDIRDILLRNADPEHACRELVAAANAAGGEDNISVIVVDAGERPRAGDTSAPPVTIERPSVERPRPRRLLGVPRRVAVIAAGATAAVLLVVAGLAWIVDRPSYVLSYRGGKVVLLNGTPAAEGDAARGKVVRVYEREPIDRFPAPVRRALRSGIPVSSKEDADRRVSALPHMQGEHATPTPSPAFAEASPTTSPGAGSPAPSGP